MRYWFAACALIAFVALGIVACSSDTGEHPDTSGLESTQTVGLDPFAPITPTPDPTPDGAAPSDDSPVTSAPTTRETPDATVSTEASQILFFHTEW